MAKMTEQEADRIIGEWLAEYLRANGPEVRHQLVMETNFDGENPVLDFIADRPDTDAATILMLYWMLAPRWLKQYAAEEDAPEYEQADYRFVYELEARYLAGFYTNQTIAWNPADDGGLDWTAEYADKPANREIPPEMRRPLIGKTVSWPDDWVEGVPPELQPKVNALIAEMDD